MTDELSKLNFDQDYDEVISSDDGKRWILERPNDLEVWAKMSSERTPDEIFQARLLWVSYPSTEPPSLKFRDIETGRLDLPTAWPDIRGFRPDSLDACVNYSLEGFVLHPEWKNDPNLRWTSNGNVLLKVLRILQREFDQYFTKRHGS